MTYTIRKKTVCIILNISPSILLQKQIKINDNKDILLWVIKIEISENKWKNVVNKLCVLGEIKQNIGRCVKKRNKNALNVAL